MAWDGDSFKAGFTTGRALWNSHVKYMNPLAQNQQDQKSTANTFFHCASPSVNIPILMYMQKKFPYSAKNDCNICLIVI